MMHEPDDALARAWKIQIAASTLGFDWPDVHGPMAKVREETQEIEDALARGDLAQAQKELGDLLFAAVNAARFLDVDPAHALHHAINSFNARFQFVKDQVAGQNRNMRDFTLDELDHFWNEAKKQIKS